VASYYLYTSALVKRYATERGTAWIISLTDPAPGHDLWTVRLTGPEMIAALFRKVRTGELAPAAAVRAATDFRTDWQQHYQLVEIVAPVTDEAMVLAERHGLRGYDAVHLAAALEVDRAHRAGQLPGLVFVSADVNQLQMAQREGLTVDNPNNHA
jgi:predicted nucleic acid-binding protein